MIDMVVEKRGTSWCVVHAHPRKQGSKTDKPPGAAIKCYPIDKLGDAEAKRRAEAMHAAIMHSEERQSHDGDSLVLRNQPVSHEGVLPYFNDDGTITKKLKRWEDLKANIGRIVPVLDEHPNVTNGNGGMFSGNEKIMGWATLKQYKDEHELAADLVLHDTAPLKHGYSAGYPYVPLVEQGTFLEETYDMIQAALWIDHVALTDMPRDEAAVLLAGDGLNTDLGLLFGGVGFDSTSTTRSPDQALKCAFGYDSYKFDASRKNEIRDLILKDNPDLDATKLIALVEKMFADEQHHPRTLKKKGQRKMAELEAVVDNIGTDAIENAKLKAEIEKLRAEKAVLEAKKDNDARMATLQKELDAIKKDRDALLQTQVDSMVSFLVGRGFKKDDYAGKTRDYIQGAFDAASNMSTGPELGESVGDANMGKDKDTDDVHDLDSTKWLYNPESGKMEYQTDDGPIPVNKLNIKGKPAKN